MNADSDNNNDAIDTTCASCGIAEIDDVKLKECDGCDLVRYCGDACQELHRPEHAGKCRKRAAELRDKLLFKQPDSSHLGDCPICSLPLPLDLNKSALYGCCSKTICTGCSYANEIRMMEMRLGRSCPFCRAAPKTKEEAEKLVLKRVEANDPEALFQVGTKWYKKGKYIKAFKYFAKAAKLDHAEAHYRLSCLYHHGEGVEKDRGKSNYHLEEAAIGGHPVARVNLGVYEWEKNNYERAVKHYIIAATQGQDEPMKNLMDAFKLGFVEKEDLAAVLRANKAAVDATKSPQRKAAEDSRRFE